MKLEYLKLDILEEEARKLPSSHRIAFAASICERLLPNYNIFSREEERGNSSLLRTALDEIWLFTEGKPFDAVGLRHLIVDCENAIPHDHDNHYSCYVSEAQNAAISICNAL